MLTLEGIVVFLGILKNINFLYKKRSWQSKLTYYYYYQSYYYCAYVADVSLNAYAAVVCPYYWYLNVLQFYLSLRCLPCYPRQYWTRLKEERINLKLNCKNFSLKRSKRKDLDPKKERWILSSNLKADWITTEFTTTKTKKKASF